MKTEREIKDSVPFREGRTFKQYSRAVKAAFEKYGYRTYVAIYDKNGNCNTCGEAGRCAGVHAVGVVS